jgi:hypothetical protein
MIPARLQHRRCRDHRLENLRHQNRRHGIAARAVGADTERLLRNVAGLEVRDAAHEVGQRQAFVFGAGRVGLAEVGALAQDRQQPTVGIAPRVSWRLLIDASAGGSTGSLARGFDCLDSFEQFGDSLVVRGGAFLICRLEHVECGSRLLHILKNFGKSTHCVLACS